MKIHLSLQNRIFLSLGGLALIALLVVWIVIRPLYEKAVVGERITILEELQSHAVRNLDRQIGSWIGVTKQIASEMTTRPSGGEAMIVNTMSLFPNIVQIRVYSPGFSQQVNSQNVNYPAPQYKSPDSMFVASNDSAVELAWITGLTSNPPDFLFTKTKFLALGRVFFVLVTWDATTLEQYLTSLPFGSDYFLGVYSRNYDVYSSRLDLRIIDSSYNYRKTNNLRVIRFAGDDWQTVTSTFQNARMNIVVAVPQRSIVAPVHHLLVYSSMLIVIISLVLLGLGWVISRQVNRPVAALVKDVERLSDLDFSQAVRVPEMPDLRKMGDTVENMRRSLERYQKINVERIILEESKNKLLMNHSDDPIAITDDEGKFMFRNERFNELSRFLSLDTESARKRELLQHPKINRLKESVVSERGEAFTVQFVQSELKLEPDNESARFYRVNDLSILRGEENLGSLIIFHDLTNDRIIDQMKTDMMNVIVHELRNRVASVSMLSAFLDGHEVVEESKRKEFLRLIVKNSQTLNDLISRFLDISRLESRRVDYPKELSDIVQIVRDELDRQKPLLEDKSLDARLTVSGEVPQVMAVHDLIRDAIANLISNAIKYGDPGRRIDIIVSLQNRSVVTSVIDHGYGIPADAQEKLFTKFFRVTSNEKARKQVGTGLGLAYVKEIAEYHNGSVTLESNPEVGCKFSLIIPVSNDKES